MKVMKKVYIVLILFTFLSLNLFCEASGTIDATSSASQIYRISGGTVNDSSATIQWSSIYDNGQLKIRWGMDSLKMENSKSLYPYQRGTTAEVVLDNLKPDTEYHYRIDGFWHGMEFMNLMSGSFKTKSSKKILKFLMP